MVEDNSTKKNPQATSQNVEARTAACAACLRLYSFFGLLASGLFFFLPCSRAFAISGWFDDSFRRQIVVNWNAENAGGYELCYAEFYTGGHLNPDASDLRIATDDGRQTQAKVMTIGPGDKVSVVFSLVKGVTRYYAYFGNPTPPANRQGFDDVKLEAGLMLEMREWKAGRVGGFEQIDEAWAKAGTLVGRTMIETPFYGINPFGYQGPTISKIHGSAFAALEGDYTFAVFVEDHGGLEIDGQKLLFANAGRADVSQQAKIHLKRGRHDFIFYQLSRSGNGRFTVAWLRPDSKNFEVVPRMSFGLFARGEAASLEELHKTAAADFSVQYAGEAFYADEYSHHYIFTAQEPKVSLKGTYEWDFGDGQTASGPLVEHVYLVDGVYPVRLSMRVGVFADSVTNRLSVSRDWPHIENPLLDKLSIQSRIVSAYDVAKMPPDWLPRATWLHERAGNIPEMLAAGGQLASLERHPDAERALAALIGAARAAAAKNEAPGAVKMWDKVPADSNLQPRAAGAFGRFLLWQMGDVARAARVLEPFATVKDPAYSRLYGEALVLNNKAAEGRAILEAFPVAEESNKRAARSGALARTIEYYIENKEWESGEDQWDNWQLQYPADFLEGYSVALKVKLMELKGAPQPAAAIAEAFAKSMPGSSYAPQLLFKAGKLLETTEPLRSQALIKLLKERYPEDPLSQ